MLSERQKEFLSWKFGLFFHFGIRTFYPGRRDWDRIPMEADRFCPEEFDPGQWMEVARKAGARYTVLTTKHHDGFALWQSEYSRFGVRESSWRNGKGDVVREYTEAARKAGIKVGLYYSLAEWNGSEFPFSDEENYDRYVIGQLTELLSDYGKIDYLWFDGNGTEGHHFNIPAIKEKIYALQPDILLFADPEWEPSVFWIGNETGYAGAGSHPEPAECDCMVRDTWFYDDNEETVKSVGKLRDMYENSVGRGCNMLLNIGPDRRGLLPEPDVLRVLGITRDGV